MKNAKISMLVLLPILLAALSTPAAAQANSCTYQYQYFYGDPIIPGSTCQSEGPYLEVCTVLTCAPPAAASETAPGHHCPNCEAGGPISLGSGNVYLSETDVTLPGLGGGLTLTRTWNSMWPASQSASAAGMFGLNWRSTYEERVFDDGDSAKKYARADGSFWSFGWDPTTSTTVVLAPATQHATIVQNTNNWTITFKNGEKRTFDLNSGSLTSIVDRNGNTTTLTYDAQNRLITVADPAGRHLYFNYNGSSPLVTSVTTDFGVTISYTYDASSRLTAATNSAANIGWQFTYGAGSRITSVKDQGGNLLESHTYDTSGRGLTSSRALSADSLTVSYPH